MLDRFNGIDITFIILIGLYLITLAFMIFYSCGLFLDHIQDKHISKVDAKRQNQGIPEKINEKTTKIKTKTKAPVKKTTNKNDLINKEKLEATKKKTSNTKKKSTTTPTKKTNNSKNTNNGYRKATQKKKKKNTKTKGKTTAKKKK